MSNTNIQIPPGKKLEGSSQDVLCQTEVFFEIDNPKNGSYTPSNLNSLSINPRTPIVQALSSSPGDTTFNLNIYSICFIGFTKAKASSKNLTAYYQINATDPTMMDIYIAYNEKPTPATNFGAYQYTFQIKDVSNTVNKVNVVVWNEDTEGSRGTLTTVKSAT